MNKVKAWLKTNRLKQILMVFLAGILVLVSTACEGGFFTKNADGVKEVKTLYQGAEAPEKRADVEKALPLKTLKDFEKSKPGGLIQRESDLDDRVEDRLEKVKDSFDEASKFIKEDAKEALERHEASPKPGLR
jgi:outer membrane protein assembly factor BamD (BamD/ComL family)